MKHGVCAHMRREKNGFEDLVEFYRQWPDLREKVERMIDCASLEAQDKNILRSMVHIVDCVGPADLQPDAD